MADSLYAIKKVVYEEKIMTLERLVEILDTDFAGFEKERKMLIDLPKYGNDHTEVDALHYDLSVFVNHNIFEKAKEAGFPPRAGASPERS
jgi:pyruvate-formate lyase